MVLHPVVVIHRHRPIIIRLHYYYYYSCYALFYLFRNYYSAIQTSPPRLSYHSTQDIIRSTSKRHTHIHTDLHFALSATISSLRVIFLKLAIYFTSPSPLKTLQRTLYKFYVPPSHSFPAPTVKLLPDLPKVTSQSAPTTAAAAALKAISRARCFPGLGPTHRYAQ